MSILLRIDDLQLPEPAEHWFESSQSLAPILDALGQVKLWKPSGYYGVGDKKPRPFESTPLLIEQSHKWHQGTFVITDGIEKDATINLKFYLKRQAVSFHILIEERYLSKTPDLLSPLIQFVISLHTTYAGEVKMGPSTSIEMIGPVYPRVRPPRYHRHFIFGALATILDHRFYQHDEKGSREDAQKLLKAPTPAWAQRIDRDELTIFRWVDDLADRAHVQQRRSQQEQWLVNVLDPPLDSSYNAAGDYRATPIGATGSNAPLTSYDTGRKYGYKAVVVFPDGGVDEELFTEMTNWIRQHRLPDGRELQVLYLITQSRSAALLIHARAIRMGIKAVYYSDNQGQLWDPFPPGPWIERSS